MIEELKVRRARKRWECQAREHHVDCSGTIGPGRVYAEYLGEAHAYQSGTRYSLPCAREAFGEVDYPVCDHGIEVDGICSDCRERRTGVPAREEV